MLSVLVKAHLRIHFGQPTFRGKEIMYLGMIDMMMKKPKTILCKE